MTAHFSTDLSHRPPYWGGLMRYDLGEIGERIRLYCATVLGVLLFASAMAFLLSAQLRTTIAAAIARLVSATRSVSETGDYGVGAELAFSR